MRFIKKIIENFYIDFYEQWSQLWKKCNWYTVTPIHIYFENDKTVGQYESEITFLGLTIRLTLIKFWSKDRKDFEEKAEDWKKNINEDNKDTVEYIAEKMQPIDESSMSLPRGFAHTMRCLMEKGNKK